MPGSQASLSLGSSASRYLRPLQEARGRADSARVSLAWGTSRESQRLPWSARAGHTE